MDDCFNVSEECRDVDAECRDVDAECRDVDAEYRDVDAEYHDVDAECRDIKDFQEINYYYLWGEHLARPITKGGQDAHPTINDWVFFYLQVPDGECRLG